MMKRPIRVLHVIGMMDRGGAEAMIMNLYRNIKRDFIQFDFLVHTQEDKTYDEEIRSLGGHIYRISRFRGVNFTGYYRECCMFFDEHPEISIVHGHIGSSAAIYLQAAKEHGLCTIAHSHSADKTHLNFSSLSYKVVSFPTRYISDYFFGCSTEAGIARFGRNVVNSPQYFNVRNAIDILQFQYNSQKRKVMRTVFGISDNSFIVGTVGRLTDAKNPEFIYTLFERIVAVNSDIKCIWVGTGEREKDYKARIHAAGLQDRIIMTGARSDVADIMQVFDCFVLPSSWEGLPVVGIEAQTSGLPCIFSNRISKELRISNLVTWLPVTQGIKLWIETIYEIRKTSIERYSPIQEIKKAGYDITDSVEWLSSFYMKHAKVKTRR